VLGWGGGGNYAFRVFNRIYFRFSKQEITHFGSLIEFTLGLKAGVGGGCVGKLCIQGL